MSRKTRKLIWSVPLIAAVAVIGALAAFAAMGARAACSPTSCPTMPQKLTVKAAERERRADHPGPQLGGPGQRRPRYVPDRRLVE